MKKVIMAAILCSNFLNFGAQAANLNLLYNDKEVTIAGFNSKEKVRISAAYQDPKFNNQIKNLFYQSVQDYLRSDNLKCEFRIPNFFENYLHKAKLNYSKADILEHYKMLRVNNFIDDILYESVRDITVDLFAMRDLENLNRTEKGISKVKAKLLEVNDINEHYENFRKFPDENSVCVYQEFIHLKNIIFSKDNKLSQDTNDFKYLNGHALYNKVIDDNTFRKLEYLRTQSTITKRELWLQDYFKIIFNAKNKMIPEKKLYVYRDFDKENKFSTEKASRKERLTRRKLLYLKYDETQIIQLATVLQNASRRMGSDPDTRSSAPAIIQSFEVTLQNGKRETYVEKHELDPQSQYVYARRMLRKDVLNLQMMDSFNKLKITYEDVVMAALETGYINFEDIEFVITYDDLWNPTKSRQQKMFGFLFDVAGYGSFVLPPPWNIAAAIALGVTEGIVESKFETGADHDNPATIFE